MDLGLGQRLHDLSGPTMLTGHSDFKGTWTTFLLERIGISGVGLSLPPEGDSLFGRAKRVGLIPEEFIDVRDYSLVQKFIEFHQPLAIIHMAVQPLVLASYASPRITFETNIMGTADILEAAY